MALHFGYGAVEEFHTGLRQMDEHVLTAPLRENIPALMGTDGLKQGENQNQSDVCVSS
jgi:glucose-6-phosphate isomerase